MSLNILDKTIGYFNPKYEYKAAMYRQASRLFHDGGIYEGARDSNNYLTGFTTSVDEDIRDLETLRDTSRDKYKNNGFIEGLINCAVDHTIGDGLVAKSSLDRKALSISDERANQIEDTIDRYFNSWAMSNICDITAKDNFYLMQRLAYMTYLIDGDCFSLLPLTNIGNDRKILQVDLIGSENIESNNIDFIEGIKVSKNKMPVQYSIRQSDGTYKVVSAFKNGKRNVLHTFERKRIKQVRGIPFATSVLRDAEYIDQYMKHELTAAKLSSLFFGSITSQSKDGIFGEGSSGVDLLTGKQEQTKKNTVKENSITELQVGDQLDIHPAGRTSPDFDKFVSTTLQKFSSAKRIPLEIILAQFVSSYTASRAAMISMQKFVKPQRALFINSFCKPTRDQVITWGILQGDIIIPEFFENRSEFLKCRWIGEPIMSVDPMKDINAKVKSIENNLTTYDRATMELGTGNFEENVEQLKKEKELLKPLIEMEQLNDN
jgi:lambda family phage portal protein